MNIKALRDEKGLTLEAFAAAVGLTSKGHASDIEQGNATPSVKVALAIEALSDGRIAAHRLNPDVALVRAAEARAA